MEASAPHFFCIPRVPLRNRMERYFYLALDLLSIAFPLVASFEPRIAYWKKWRGLFTGIAVMAMVFLSWDAIFTANGVWGFSPRYTLGIRFVRDQHRNGIADIDAGPRRVRSGGILVTERLVGLAAAVPLDKGPQAAVLTVKVDSHLKIIDPQRGVRQPGVRVEVD